MAENSTQLHEAREDIDDETLEKHRAIVSLMEELEAIDWYQQRIDGAKDEELKAILAHNRDEEKEHAAMTLEWLRRRDEKLSEELATYLFTDEPIMEVEEHEDDEEDGEEDDASASPSKSLGVGSLKS